MSDEIKFGEITTPSNVSWSECSVYYHTQDYHVISHTCSYVT